jgi:hypothetical protein
MPQFYKMLKPIPDEDPVAYYLDDVLKHMSAAHRKKLDTWLEEHPITISNDRGIIYREELEEFFETL